MRLLLAAILLALAPAPALLRAEPVKVVASFSILADLARNVGGDRAEVVALVGPDADPHGYEPRPSDVRKLADAAVLVVNGLGFDPWADRLAAAAGFRGRRVVASAGLPSVVAADPHAWQSIPDAIAYVDAIAEGLAAARPADAEAFRSAAAAYKASLADLDREIRGLLDPLPADRRTLIVPHRAFDYFGRDYGLTFLAPLGTDADAEASASAVAALAGKLRRGEAQAVLGEHLEDRRVVQRIAAETGRPIQGELYSDTLSPPGGPAATYVALMRHNARVIAAALAPPPAGPGSP